MATRTPENCPHCTVPLAEVAARVGYPEGAVTTKAAALGCEIGTDAFGGRAMRVETASRFVASVLQENQRLSDEAAAYQQYLRHQAGKARADRIAAAAAERAERAERTQTARRSWLAELATRGRRERAEKSAADDEAQWGRNKPTEGGFRDFLESGR